jgi:hypothetical protein
MGYVGIGFSDNRAYSLSPNLIETGWAMIQNLNLHHFFRSQEREIGFCLVFKDRKTSYVGLISHGERVGINA